MYTRRINTDILYCKHQSQILWSEKFANDVLSASNRDYDGKNPLELAVEQEHVR